MRCDENEQINMKKVMKILNLHSDFMSLLFSRVTSVTGHILERKSFKNHSFKQHERASCLVLNGPYKHIAVCLEDKPGCVLSKDVPGEFPTEAVVVSRLGEEK